MPFVLANIFQPLIDVFEAVIRWIHGLGLGWGLSIILLTVLVRIVLVPLTLKQFKSMQAMQRLAPEIKALQEKYKDDKQRQQQEMMAFYKENQVNPFGSCLPLLLQFPVFISLFYMLRKDLKVDICPEKLAHVGAIQIVNGHHHVLNSGKLQSTACGTHSAHFLFIDDITTKATGGVLVALIVMYIGSQLASSVLMSVSADRNQRMLMIGLPFLFVTFIIRFPAGLIVYWITTNLWTVGQQYVVRRTIGPIRPPGTAPAGAAAISGGGGGSGGAAAKPSSKEKDKNGDGSKPAPRASAPPPSARKKKKRSGRRR
jgi:YidC/Oxa1 family membrane protein insertase